MKEDITQLLVGRQLFTLGCGLVMKEDITQLGGAIDSFDRVVVW